MYQHVTQVFARMGLEGLGPVCTSARPRSVPRIYRVEADVGCHSDNVIKLVPGDAGRRRGVADCPTCGLWEFCDICRRAQNNSAKAEAGIEFARLEKVSKVPIVSPAAASGVVV